MPGQEKVGFNTSVEWPVGVGGKGNEGVANFTGQTPNSIGYVEYAYALQNHLSYALMSNREGHFLKPESKTFQSAAANADWAKADGFYLVLTDQPGKDSWPITGASFILMHKSQEHTDRAADSLKFFKWSYANGGKMADELDYVPMPQNVVKMVETMWSKEIKGTDGKPISIDIELCLKGSWAVLAPMVPFSNQTMNSISTEARLETAPMSRGMQRETRKAARVTRGAGLELFFIWLTRMSAIIVMLLLAGIFAVLFIDSLPALQKFGAAFLFSDSWNPVTEKFGALAPVCGTLISSFIAMLVGVPLALGVALFINELCPYRLRPILTVTVELLAAIPSIIYGMWGLFVLAPIMASHVQPVLIKWIGPLPVLGALFQGPPFGIGMLTAGLILGIMILPFIASVSRQVFATTPPMLRDAAYGIGANTWEVCRHVLIPYARTGLLGGIMLGLGRALGETMAVTFVIGNAHRIAVSILAPGTTISATLANEFTEAIGDLYLSSLLALGLILFLITFAVLFLARFLLRRIEVKVAA